uniref:Reverse transcriptase domain-containing protein n=1 Tax=Haemonchus contortus TaxID=6289 RepID=A0A7I4YKB3_HAECO
MSTSFLRSTASSSVTLALGIIGEASNKKAYGVMCDKATSAALENIMRHLEWEDLGVKVDGRFLHHLRFADDIVLITPNIEQAERMLAEFDSACERSA